MLPSPSSTIWRQILSSEESLRHRRSRALSMKAASSLFGAISRRRRTRRIPKSRRATFTRLFERWSGETRLRSRSQDRLDAIYATASHPPGNAGRCRASEFRKLLEEIARYFANFYLAVCYYRSRRLDTVRRSMLRCSVKRLRPAEELWGRSGREGDYLRRGSSLRICRHRPGNFNAHFNLDPGDSRGTHRGCEARTPVSRPLDASSARPTQRSARSTSRKKIESAGRSYARPCYRSARRNLAQGAGATAGRGTSDCRRRVQC